MIKTNAAININMPTPRNAKNIRIPINNMAISNVGMAAKRIKGSATGSPLITRLKDLHPDEKSIQGRL